MSDNQVMSSREFYIYLESLRRKKYSEQKESSETIKKSISSDQIVSENQHWIKIEIEERISLVLRMLSASFLFLFSLGIFIHAFSTLLSAGQLTKEFLVGIAIYMLFAVALLVLVDKFVITYIKMVFNLKNRTFEIWKKRIGVKSLKNVAVLSLDEYQSAVCVRTPGASPSQISFAALVKKGSKTDIHKIPGSLGRENARLYATAVANLCKIPMRARVEI